MCGLLRVNYGMTCIVVLNSRRTRITKLSVLPFLHCGGGSEIIGTTKTLNQLFVLHRSPLSTKYRHDDRPTAVRSCRPIYVPHTQY